MLKRQTAAPQPGSRRTYVIARDRLAGSPAEIDAALALRMAQDIADTATARGNATCTEDDLARLGWSRQDIRALGDAARAHLLAGPMADELRALERLAA
jgi:hypothetical protein